VKRPSAVPEGIWNQYNVKQRQNRGKLKMVMVMMFFFLLFLLLLVMVVVVVAAAQQQWFNC